MPSERQNSRSSDEFWDDSDVVGEDNDGSYYTTTTAVSGRVYYSKTSENDDLDEPTPAGDSGQAKEWVTQPDRTLFASVAEAGKRRRAEERKEKEKSSAPPAFQSAEEEVAYWKSKYEREVIVVRDSTPLAFSGSNDGASPTVSRSRAPREPCSCTDYSCLLEPGIFRDLDYFQWCKSHGFFTPRCERHGDANLKEENSRWVCQCPSGDGGTCRRVAAPMAPPVNPTHLFTAVHTLANGLSVGKLCKSSLQLNKIHRNTLGPICHNIAKCCLVESQVNLPQWARIEVDETCIGRRKYQRGKRTRKLQYWFWSATAYSKDKKTEGTIWKACTRRTKAEAEKFINSVAMSLRTRVATDCAKCYMGLSAAGYKHHKKVNHSIGFKAPDGTTTNKAENSHGVVKKYVRSVWGGFGKTGEQVEVRAATGAALYVAGGTHERMVILLKLVKRHWGVDPTITLDENAVKEVPGKGQAKPAVVAEEPEEGGSASDDEEEESDDDEPGVMFAKLRAEDVLPSLGDRQIIYAQAIRTALKQHQVPFVDQGQKDWPEQCGHLPRLLAQEDKMGLVMWHSGHWFGGVADKKANKVFFMDSSNQFEKEHREICLNNWCSWIEKLWTDSIRPPRAVQRQLITQQADGSHDGGVHTIRNILTALGVTDAPTYGRVQLRTLMKRQAKKEEEEERAAAIEQVKAAVAAEARKKTAKAAVKKEKAAKKPAAKKTKKK